MKFNFFKPKRMFYVKLSGMYLNTEKNTTPRWYAGIRCHASKYTDKEYDAIKPLLPNDHTLELVK